MTALSTMNALIFSTYAAPVHGVSLLCPPTHKTLLCPHTVDTDLVNT